MLVRLQTENEYLKRGMQTRVDPNDPEAVLGRTRDEFTSAADKQIYEQRIAPLEKKYNDLQQSLQQKEAQRATAARVQQYQQESESAATDLLLKGFPPEIARKISGPMAALVNNAAYGLNSDAKQGALYLRNILMDYMRGLMAVQVGPAKDALTGAQGVPPVQSGRGQAGASGNGVPTMKEAIEAGYKNPLDMMIKQDQGR